MQVKRFGIARQAAQNYTIVVYLVARAIEDITMSGLRRILTHNLPNAEWASSAASAISYEANKVQLKQAMRGDDLALASSFTRSDQRAISWV